MELSSQVVELASGRYSYHVSGRGPTCSVYPGGPGLGSQYMRMPALEDFITAIYVEPVGTGGSGRLDDPAQYTIDRYTDDLAQRVDSLGLGTVLLLGHSHGGFVALKFATRRPEALNGLIVYSAAARLDDDWIPAARTNIAAFTERHRDRAEVADVVSANSEWDDAETDEQSTCAFRRQLPLYVADPWSPPPAVASLAETGRSYAGPNSARRIGTCGRSRVRRSSTRPPVPRDREPAGSLAGHGQSLRH